MNINTKRTGAGIALALAVVTGSAGLLQLGDEPAQAAVGGPDGLSVDVLASPAGTDHIEVGYRVHGTAGAWSDPTTNEPIDYAGPAYTRILVDGEEQGGTDGGAMVCAEDAPEQEFDETWEPVRVAVPGPGTYEITVDAPYCVDGATVPHEETVTVTVPAA